VKSRPRLTLAAMLCLFLAMGLFTVRRLELSSGMADLIPESTEQELALISASLVDSPLTRTMVLSVGASDLTTAVAAARRWESTLAGHPEVATLRTGPDESLPEAIFELYFPRRLLFLSTRPEDELPERLSPPGLRQAARELREVLALPTARLVREVASADPLLVFPALLRRLQQARHGSLEVVEGHFVDRDDPSAILFLTTRHSAFDVRSQVPFGAFLEGSFSELEREFPKGLRLERSGVHRFAAASERHAREDMQRISSISMVAITLVFLVVFRSLRLLAISLLPLLGGLLTATTVGILLFGKLHVMTLAFGSTLIGVCIDYPLHYLSHHVLLPAADGPYASLRRVWGAIAMGAATTMAGFIVFAGSDFPAVRQIGAFSATGILGALITTRVLLPPLMPVAREISRLQASTLELIARLLEGMGRRRVAPGTILLLASGVVVVGLPRAQWQDDVFALDIPPEQSWLEEDARVRAQVSQMDAGSFVVAFGDDAESALRRNDDVFARLERARDAGRIERFRSLHPFLYSAQLQRRNLAALSELPDLPERTLDALEAEGFRREAFQPFARAIEAEAPPPLRFDDLAGSPLADMVAPFRIDLENRTAILTFLKGVTSSEELTALFADLDGVHYFEQRRFLAKIIGHYRWRTVTLVGVGLIAVAALLYTRYRRIRTALATLAPCLLAAALTLALHSLLGIRINLLHLLGLLLVLSIGVDYAVFLLASGPHPPTRAAAMLGLCLACLSTCLAFGLLATSSFPALRALGSSTFIGVLLSLILAPSVLVLMEPARESA
jgi:predicted exporter